MINIQGKSGLITIDDDVFMNLAGDAATSCFGVKGMVTCSKDGGPWQILHREAMSKGVKVIAGENGTVAIELHIGVDRGINIEAVCASIVNEVRYKLSQTTGIEPAAVDVFIDTITD